MYVKRIRKALKFRVFLISMFFAGVSTSSFALSPFPGFTFNYLIENETPYTAVLGNSDHYEGLEELSTVSSAGCIDDGSSDNTRCTNFQHVLFDVPGNNEHVWAQYLFENEDGAVVGYCQFDVKADYGDYTPKITTNCTNVGSSNEGNLVATHWYDLDDSKYFAEIKITFSVE